MNTPELLYLGDQLPGDQSTAPNTQEQDRPYVKVPAVGAVSESQGKTNSGEVELVEAAEDATRKRQFGDHSDDASKAPAAAGSQALQDSEDEEPPYELTLRNLQYRIPTRYGVFVDPRHHLRGKAPRQARGDKAITFYVRKAVEEASVLPKHLYCVLHDTDATPGRGVRPPPYKSVKATEMILEGVTLLQGVFRLPRHQKSFQGFFDIYDYKPAPKQELPPDAPEHQHAIISVHMTLCADTAPANQKQPKKRCSVVVAVHPLFLPPEVTHKDAGSASTDASNCVLYPLKDGTPPLLSPSQAPKDSRFCRFIPYALHL